ncbi:MAG: hypothetical protein HRU19_29900 [Pseudobacteriovorax sp.]|nr:hypothetical protein [Pseudobacteriovorax sp.]
MWYIRFIALSLVFILGFNANDRSSVGRRFDSIIPTEIAIILIVAIIGEGLYAYYRYYKRVYGFYDPHERLKEEEKAEKENDQKK